MPISETGSNFRNGSIAFRELFNRFSIWRSGLAEMLLDEVDPVLASRLDDFDIITMDAQMSTANLMQVIWRENLTPLSFAELLGAASRHNECSGRPIFSISSMNVRNKAGGKPQVSLPCVCFFKSFARAAHEEEQVSLNHSSRLEMIENIRRSRTVGCEIITPFNSKGIRIAVRKA